jgi:hypothetical protein
MVSKVENEEGVAESEARAQRREARAQRQAARPQKAGEPGRAHKLCSFSTVEVKKSEEGYQVFVTTAGRRSKFTISPGEVGPVLKDLETAIHVIRGQQ